MHTMSSAPTFSSQKQKAPSLDPRRTRRCRKGTRVERSSECRADGCPPLAQHNLLYAVSFLRSPELMDAFSFARAAGGLGILNLTSNMQSLSTSFAHPRRHLPYNTLPTHFPHDGIASSTSQHTSPSPGRHGCLRPCRRAPQRPS